MSLDDQASDLEVSIHTSRCREVLRFADSADLTFYNGFNPHLPLPGGVAVVLLTSCDAWKVSIHTSRCREVLPEYEPQGVLPICEFQSTPPVAGRCCLEARRATLGHSGVSIHTSRCREVLPSAKLGVTIPFFGFQSTPPVAGRCCLRRPWRANRITQVSIHTSRCREVLPINRKAVVQPCQPVSIHTSRCREVLPSRKSSTPFRNSFQSTPPVAGRCCQSTRAHHLLL